MAMLAKNRKKMEVPTIEKRHIFSAYVRESPHKIWPKIWYIYVPPFKDLEQDMDWTPFRNWAVNHGDLKGSGKLGCLSLFYLLGP